MKIFSILLVAVWWFFIGFLTQKIWLSVKGGRTLTFTDTPPENGATYLLHYQYQFQDNQDAYWKKSYDVVSFYDGWDFGNEMEGKVFIPLEWAEIEYGWEGVMMEFDSPAPFQHPNQRPGSPKKK